MLNRNIPRTEPLISSATPRPDRRRSGRNEALATAENHVRVMTERFGRSLEDLLLDVEPRLAARRQPPTFDEVVEAYARAWIGIWINPR